MKRGLTICLMMIVAVSAWGKAVVFEYKGPDGNTLKYFLQSENDNTVMVGSPSCKVGNSYNSSAYNPGDYANLRSYNYESIVIPEEVIYKGKKYTVTAIGRCAFYESWSKDISKSTKVRLKRIVIPKTINKIDDAFHNCKDLEEIHITDLKAWCNIDFVNCLNPLFHNENSKLYVNGKLITQLVIPDGVKSIKCEFIDYKLLESVIIPISVESISHSCFRNCVNLKKVVLPSSLKYIDSSTFQNCKSLKNIQIHEGVEYIRSSAFQYIDIVELKLPHTIKEIEKYAFSYCKSLESVTFPNSQVTIEKEAFAGCEKLKTVIGLSSKSKIDKEAFVNSPISLDYLTTSFSYFVNSYIYDGIEKWQKKGEFESTEQWRSRVTEENRQKYVNGVINQLREKYIEKYQRSEPAATIGTYNADQGVFPVSIASEQVYVKVPQDEAQQFKSGFKSEYIQTQYDIVNDHIAVVGRTCKVGDKVYQTTNQYAKADDLSDLALNLPPLEMNFGNVSNNTSGQKTASTPVDRTIDQNIPASGITNSNTFAVIIGNEDYEHVAKVAYAKNDARVFAEYCRKTLGLPAKNVRGYENATYGKLLSAVQDIKDIAKAYNGDINIVFYYAGHGMPYGSQGEAYLLPVDADGRQINICYSLSKLYEELGALNAKSVTVLMDACFSGAQRGDGMLMAARAVALKPKVNAPRGNMVVMTAANGEQTAFPYNEKGHGMFTYYLLKKLRDTKGDCTLGELGNYIKTEVAKQAIVTNGREQTPALFVSPNISGSWQTMKLR